jgi:hypothetical protein
VAIGVNDNAGLDVACDLLRGQAPALAEQVEVWRVPGIDGVAGHKTGKGGDGYGFVAIKFGTSAAVDSWYANMQSQVGKICTVTDDWSTAYTSILITRVTQIIKTAARLSGSATSVARGEVRVEGVKAN